MSKVLINEKEVSVTSELPSIDINQVLNSKLFQNWKNSLDKKIRVVSILIQSVDIPKQILFIKFKCVAFLEGESQHPIPGIVILRGGAITCLFELICEEVAYALLVQQPRLATGKSDYLGPIAGMLDGEADVKGVALKEIEEEAGIKLSLDDLIDMTALTRGPSSLGYFSSPGLEDEFLRAYLFRALISKEKLSELQGKLTGERSHGEYITLKITPLDTLWRETDDSAILVALFLREKLLQINALPPPRELK